MFIMKHKCRNSCKLQNYLQKASKNLFILIHVMLKKVQNWSIIDYPLSKYTETQLLKTTKNFLHWPFMFYIKVFVFDVYERLKSSFHDNFSAAFVFVFVFIIFFFFTSTKTCYGPICQKTKQECHTMLCYQWTMDNYCKKNFTSLFINVT